MTSQQPANPLMSSQEPMPEPVVESTVVINISERLTKIEAQIPHLATKENFRHLDSKIQTLCSDIDSPRERLLGEAREFRRAIHTFRSDMIRELRTFRSAMQTALMWRTLITITVVITAVVLMVKFM